MATHQQAGFANLPAFASKSYLAGVGMVLTLERIPRTLLEPMRACAEAVVQFDLLMLLEKDERNCGSLPKLQKVL